MNTINTAQPVLVTQTTTGMINNGMMNNGMQQYAVYDKPADRRLRPWIMAGSAFLMAMGAAMIVLTFVRQGHLSTLWGIFIAGIIFAACGLLGFIAGMTLRPALAAAFFWTLTIGWLCALAVLIINAAYLNRNMNHHCNNGPQYTLQCQGVRQYHEIVFTAFGVPSALWVPTLIIAAGYFWRTTRLARKLPYGGAANPVGSAMM